jgi:hypothetical protein
MEKTVLSLLTWIFLLGGLFGFANGLFLFLSKATPAEYGVMGIGGGIWLLSAAVVIHIRSKLS